MPPADFPIHPGQAPRFGSRGGVRFREDTAYTNAEGQEEDGIRETADEVIDNLQEGLRNALEPDEAVLYVARGPTTVGLFEQFVFTNRRLLFFLIGHDGDRAKSLSSVRWGDVAKARVTGWVRSILKLKYRNGQREAYSGLRMGDDKKIEVLLAALLPASASEATPAQGMVPHCAGCEVALIAGTPHCIRCGRDNTVPGSAWSPKAIAFISAFFTFLPAGIMHAINYERLGYPEKKKRHLIMTLVGFPVFLGAILFTAGYEEVTRGFFSAIHVGIAGFFYKDQQVLFRRHLHRGGKKAHLRVPLALSFFWLVIVIGTVVGWNSYRTTNMLMGQRQVQGPNLVPITDPTKRLEFHGFSVLPPLGENWSIQNQGANSIVFAKSTKKGRDHTVVAFARTVSQSEVPLKAVLEYVGKGGSPCIDVTTTGNPFFALYLAFRSPRFKNLEAQICVESCQGKACGRSDLTVEDHGVPYAPGSVFILTQRDLYFLHPDSPEVVVHLSYSQRFLRGEKPLPIDAEIEPFLKSLEFTPIRPRPSSGGGFLRDPLDPACLKIGDRPADCPSSAPARPVER